MNDQKIPFSITTAEDLKNKAQEAAHALESQSATRSGAAGTILTDFKGPHADTYRANVRTVTNDLPVMVTRLQEIKYLVERAIEAYEEAKADMERNRLEQMVDDLLEAVGLSEKAKVPDSPSLPPLESVSTAPKAPIHADVPGIAIVSGVPENIRQGIGTLRACDDALREKIANLSGALSSYQIDCSWAPIDAAKVVEAINRWCDENASEHTWLEKIATEFENVTGDASQVASIPYVTLEASVGPAATRTPLAVDAPTIRGTEASAGYIGDPVNAATGNFIEPETDLTYTGASSALTFTRMYNAGNDQTGLFGIGWSSSLDSRLILTDERATWVKEDGQHLIFPRAGQGWERAHLHALWLTQEQPNHVGLSLPAEHTHHQNLLVIRDNAGQIWVFSPAGTYLGHKASDGNVITFTYNSENLPTRITHSRGRFIDIEYVGGYVAYIQGHEGSRVEYSYDCTGHLLSATTAVGTRSYAYNEAGLISAVTAADGTVEVENTYDQLGRVSSQNYPHGVVRRYSYLSGGVTLVANEDGSHANTWISDEHGRLIGMIDANQQRQSMGYDTFNNRVSVTERDGSTTVRLFNKRGLLTREVTPEGADITCQWDEHDRLITMMTASGAVLSYEYADSTGEQRNPAVLIDALGGRTEMVWRDGLLMSMLGPTGVGVTFTYDALGDLVGVTNAAGHTTRFERDASGRVTELVTPLGARTAFTYDGAGHLVAREDADGAVWRFTYGVGDRLTEVKDPAGAVTTYEYGVAGDVVAVVDPLGRRTARSFDSMGNVSSLVTPSGSTWVFNYDELMQNVGVVDPLGHMWAREFDVNGEVTALIDPTGVRTSAQLNRSSGIQTITDAFGSYTTHFDAYGRPVKESTPDGSEEVFTYDAAGNVVEILDAEGHLTVLGRDARGEITSITSPEGRVTSFNYDECGRPWTMTDPAGVTTTLTYDADSRVVGRASSSGAFEELTYDAVSRVLVQRTNTGVARYGYDVCGRVTSAFDTKFGRRRFAYDAAGQLVKAVSGLGGVTRFEYTADGLLAARTDAHGAVTRFTYDAAHQLVSATDSLGRVTRASYDAAGRLVTTVNPDGGELSYSYDAAGLLEKSFFNQQLIARVEREALTRTVKIYDYTTFGTDLIAKDLVPTIHTLSHDRLGRVSEYNRSTSGALNTHAQGSNTCVSYTYTPDGATASTTVDGVSTHYTYAAHTGLLTSALRSTATGREELTYHYNAVTAALVKITDATGALVRSFDAVPTVVPETPADTAEPTETRYRADGGWVTISTNTHPATGELVEFKTYYNSTGLVIGEEDPVDGLRLYTYDEAHQLTSVRSDAGIHSFEYSPAGFLVRETTPDGTTRHYSYNTAGQLTRLEDSQEGTWEYIYDGLGRRIRATTPDGCVNHYAYATGGGLPGEIRSTHPHQGALEGCSERCAASTGAALWVDALGQVAGVRSAAGDCFLSWDVTGSVPSVVGVAGVPVSLGAGVAGVPTGVRGVDPFGVSPLVVGAGSAGTAGVGVTASGSLGVGDLEILGARVYDRQVRGFISPDPLVSPVGAGWSANVYAFVGFAPVGLVDPWGLSPMTAGEFREYRQDTRGRAWTRVGGQLGNWANKNADGLALLAIGVGVIVGGIALAATGPVGLIVAGAISGAALSGGLSILTNKNEDGTVDWKKVGLDTVIGGVAGGVGGAAVSLVGKASSLMNAGRATRTALKAERVGAKAGALAQKASGASWYNPMKYMNSWRAQQFGQRAASLSARADEFSQFAAHYGDVGGFARSMSGQTVQGVATNVTSNNLAYATGDFKEHTAGGYARATVSGVGVGVVSPRITPLRQQVFSSANPDAGLVEKTLRPVTAFAADRFADFGVGVGNYVVTPQEKDLTWDDAFKEGVKSTVGGGAGEFSTRRADGVRPATPRMSGE